MPREVAKPTSVWVCESVPSFFVSSLLPAPTPFSTTPHLLLLLLLPLDIRLQVLQSLNSWTYSSSPPWGSEASGLVLGV
jgi:hypothetical protein